MPVSALLLALGAAGLHALWNVLVAGARDQDAAMAGMLVVASIVFAPVAAATWDVSRAAAPYVAASSVLELAYFVLLARAYRVAEVSLVYPLARGLAPVFVLALSAGVLSAATSGVQIAGVLLVGCGVVLVRGLRRTADPRGVLLAIAVAGCISGYTVLDKSGIAHAGPITYLELVQILPTVAYAATIASSSGLGRIRSALGPRTAVAGVCLFGAYALVLAALKLAPAAPVAAVRESSVIIATALAALVLHERVGSRRLAGAVVVVAGVILVGSA